LCEVLNYVAAYEEWQNKITLFNVNMQVFKIFIPEVLDDTQLHYHKFKKKSTVQNGGGTHTKLDFDV